MTNTKLENLAHQLAGMNFRKPRDQAAREMYQLIGHLDRIDADIVVENAKAIVRERGTAMLKESAALDALAQRKGVL